MFGYVCASFTIVIENLGNVKAIRFVACENYDEKSVARAYLAKTRNQTCYKISDKNRE